MIDRMTSRYRDVLILVARVLLDRAVRALDSKIRTDYAALWVANRLHVCAQLPSVAAVHRWSCWMGGGLAGGPARPVPLASLLMLSVVGPPCSVIRSVDGGLCRAWPRPGVQFLKNLSSWADCRCWRLPTWPLSPD